MYIQHQIFGNIYNNMISFYKILISTQNNGITVYTSHLGELDALLHRVLKVTVKPYNTC